MRRVHLDLAYGVDVDIVVAQFFLNEAFVTVRIVRLQNELDSYEVLDEQPNSVT